MQTAKYHLLPGHLNELLLLEREFLCLDVPAVNILVQQNNGRLGYAMKELYVVDLKFLDPDM